MSLKEKINLNELPKHVAIIMDGNGRWAKQKGKSRTYGHKHGIPPVREITEAASELGIKYLTLYTFSTENWNRPRFEINALMQILVTTIHSELATLNKNNIRLMAIGDLKSLPVKCYKELMSAIEKTSKNNRLTLVLALAYGSRWEIINATKLIGEKIKNNELSPDEINASLFSSYLTTDGIPDPELLIRTSGEYRISNFLLWQIAYTELFFTQKFWPDFNKEDFYQAVYDYQSRERRFGMTSEQKI